MKTQRRHLGLLAFGLVALLVPPVADAGTKADLSGDWQLDPEASDDPREAMREAMQKRRAGMGGPGGMSGPGGMGGPGGGRTGGPGGGMGRGGGRGGAGGGRMGGPGGGPGNSDDGQRQRRGEMFEAFTSATLAIRQELPAVTIVDAGGHQRILWSDGRKVAAEDPPGRQEVSTWQGDDVLRLQVTGERGRDLTESFSIDSEGRLHRKVAVQGNDRMPSFDFEMVYDKRPAADPAAASNAPQSDVNRDSGVTDGTSATPGTAPPDAVQ